MEKLLDILVRQDDKLLPSFCDALLADQKPYIVEILKRNGLRYVSIILLTSSVDAWNIFVGFHSIIP